MPLDPGELSVARDRACSELEVDVKLVESGATRKDSRFFGRGRLCKSSPTDRISRCPLPSPSVLFPSSEESSSSNPIKLSILSSNGGAS